MPGQGVFHEGHAFALDGLGDDGRRFPFQGLGLGQSRYGAMNWIILGPLSFQPSELAKICYIFAGSATLDRLFRKRNLGLFILLTVVCMGCLALMSDFGTAAIFFVTFLVIAYLRSGDWATLASSPAARFSARE